MLIRFVLPELARLDEIDSEVLSVGVFSDERPARGVAGLCDFRLRGHISRLMMRGFISGAVGEVVMLPGKPLLSYDKLLLVGLGPKQAFDIEVLRSFVQSTLTRLVGLKVRSAVVELPGRRDGLVSPAAAADVLLSEAELSEELDAWVLVDSAEARVEIESHVADHRRRVRRSL